MPRKERTPILKQIWLPNFKRQWDANKDHFKEFSAHKQQLKWFPKSAQSTPKSIIPTRSLLTSINVNSQQLTSICVSWHQLASIDINWQLISIGVNWCIIDIKQGQLVPIKVNWYIRIDFTDQRNEKNQQGLSWRNQSQRACRGLARSRSARIRRDWEGHLCFGVQDT